VLVGCWNPGAPAKAPSDPSTTQNAAHAARQAVIQLDRGGKILVLESSGVGQLDPNGVTAQAYFFVEPNDVAALLQRFEAARFRDMPAVFGVPYGERMMPFDCAREPCDRTPPPMTTKPPLYKLELRRGDVTHSVTQSAEGDHSQTFETLVNDFSAVCEAALRDRPLSNTLTLQQELDLIRDRTLPIDALHVTGGHNTYQDGSITDGWSVVIQGRDVVVTANPSNQKAVGQLSSAEYKMLRDVLASVSLPPMAYVHAPDRTHWFLAARVLHSTNINSNSGPNIQIDPDVQQAFDRAFLVLDSVWHRLAKANRIKTP
jgi:hypothetical protein